MYIVLETQTNAEGIVSTLINSYADNSLAKSKYYQILSAAAISNIPKHCAYIFDDEGMFIKSECFRHEPTE